MAERSARVAELEDALEKAADTFSDLDRVLRLLGHSTTADACVIAQAAVRAAIAGESDEELCDICGLLGFLEHEGEEYPCPKCWSAQFMPGEADKLLGAMAVARADRGAVEPRKEPTP